MSEVELTVLMKDYDHIAPLVAGDIPVPDIDLTIERETENALDRTLADESVDVGELSFSRHLIRLANDDHSFVGIPVFPTQVFRERCFFTLADNGMNALHQLAGKRVGTNEWPATGNTWSRAALRERGVDIESIDWVVAPINDPDYDMRPQGELPPHVSFPDDGRTLRDELLTGELDALMCPRPPTGLYDPDSPIVRVLEDYRAAERAYYERTGLFPTHHLMGIRRPVFEANPWIAKTLYEAFEAAKNQWFQRRRRLTDTTPWLLPEIEETTALMGHDWLPFGIDANEREIATLCREEYEQGLIDSPLAPGDVFAEYRELTD